MNKNIKNLSHSYRSSQVTIPSSIPKAMAMCIVMMKPTDPDWGRRGVTVSGALPSQLKLDECQPSVLWVVGSVNYRKWVLFHHSTRYSKISFIDMKMI